ncbi:Phage integrase family protein [Ketogulonicigenium vulgare WSH-001]|uniref:Phage integrase family protein n=1 Tax=Ketogulonicigenium vulgare (strain WSH-001) TaxID=759362 RepID=F9Y6B6_KETVW|nr:Phage integrase family protein [Ketogulonicigenium vulgare WSH-001]
MDLARAQIDLRIDAKGSRKGRAVTSINGLSCAALVSTKRQRFRPLSSHDLAAV